MFDGLVEYHPKTMDPIPAIAESWKISPDGTEIIFNLRKKRPLLERRSDQSAGLRLHAAPRAFAELAAQNAYLAYEIKYAQAYNGGESFVRDASGQFLLKKDFEEKAEEPAKPAPVAEQSAPPATNAPADTAQVEKRLLQTPAVFGPDTEFHRFITSPERLSVPSDEKGRT
jgi:ABC-type oligopeptide transport system substrate-binding subunit